MANRKVTYLPELVDNNIELSVRHLKQFFKFGHGKGAFVTKAVHNVSFDGGCDGNLKAISKLVEGQKAEELIRILEGNRCGFKPTSCADQFSKGLRQAIGEA